MAHKCCHGNPLDRYTGIAHCAFLRLFAMRREADGQRVCGSQPIAERRWCSSDSSRLSCGGRNHDPSRAVPGWVCGCRWRVGPATSHFNLCPHRQERASLRCDEHVNIAGEFHLVVVKVIVHLLPGDHVPQRGYVAHTYVTGTHRGRCHVVRVTPAECAGCGASNVPFTVLQFQEASPVVSSCPCSSWVSSKKSKVFRASCRAPLTSRLAT